MPAIFKRAGLRVSEIPVGHCGRRACVSKHNNWSRAVQGAFDLVGVGWLLKRTIRPVIAEEKIMNDTLLELQLFGTTWLLTPWKIIGYLGVAVFGGRWLVQVIASHRAGYSRLPRVFWYMSLTGSLLLLSYFIFSEKNDSVGILSNMLPCAVAAYNLFLDIRHGTRRMRAEGAPSTQCAGFNRIG